jgi:hypothetical protein
MMLPRVAIRSTGGDGGCWIRSRTAATSVFRNVSSIGVAKVESLPSRQQSPITSHGGIAGVRLPHREVKFFFKFVVENLPTLLIHSIKKSRPYMLNFFP